MMRIKGRMKKGVVVKEIVGLVLLVIVVALVVYFLVTNSDKLLDALLDMIK